MPSPSRPGPADRPTPKSQGPSPTSQTSVGPSASAAGPKLGFSSASLRDLSAAHNVSAGRDIFPGSHRSAASTGPTRPALLALTSLSDSLASSTSQRSPRDYPLGPSSSTSQDEVAVSSLPFSTRPAEADVKRAPTRESFSVPFPRPMSSVQAVGLHSPVHYRQQMSPVRFWVRSCLLASLEHEMGLLERIQARLRSEWLDYLMINSSWLGSHAFFTIALSIMFWLDDQSVSLARTLVYEFAGAVYLTGVLKDWVCLPRPYSPPIQRLSVSNHASEYGFPSTHSATSATTILIVLQRVFQSSSSTFGLYRSGSVLGLVVYGFFLIFGRVYCGMHSVQDVICGCLIGGFVWSLNLCFGNDLNEWLASMDGLRLGNLAMVGPSKPFLIIFVGLALTALHPQPIEDCPCFEDSTAFVAVMMGVMLGHWSGWVEGLVSKKISQGTLLSQEHGEFANMRIGVLGPIKLMAKVIIGMVVIFGWRWIMKEFLSRALPRLFRVFSPLIELPRRHHNPSTDYQSYRDQLKEDRKRSGLKRSLIPSVIHLPRIPISSSLRDRLRRRHGRGVDGSGVASFEEREEDVTLSLHPALRNRNGGDDEDPLVDYSQPPPSSSCCGPLDSVKQRPEHPEIGDTKAGTKRYDVDVLMRLIVYSGIGFLASALLPMLFHKLNLESHLIVLK